MNVANTIAFTFMQRFNKSKKKKKKKVTFGSLREVFCGPARRRRGRKEMEDHDLEILKQVEVYQPPADIASRAHVKSLDEYNKLYEKSVTDPDAFWGEIAERDFYWHQKWSKVPLPV